MTDNPHDPAESSQNGSDNATKTANPNDRADLVAQLRDRACPAGLPWTGENPEQDHGHTDCWLHHQAADEIERLKNAADEIERIEGLINAWYHDDGTTCPVAINETRDALRKLGGL